MPAAHRHDLGSLPKAHLHLHFVGAMRAATLEELATRHGVTVPPPATRYGSFAAFQGRYAAAVDVLRDEADLVRLVTEIAEDAKSDGAVWIEPAVNLANHEPLGSPRAVLELILGATAEASEHTGVGIGWLVEADRTLPPSVAVEHAELAVRYLDAGVVGFGLANDERAAPAEAFAEAFAIARGGGLLAVPHAGEHGGPESVIAALDVLGADRIEHGVRSVEDPGLVGRLAVEHVCLDVCPTSNLLLGVVPDLGGHPLHRLVEAGVSCSINADDPLLFGSSLLAEFEVSREAIGLSDVDLATCASSSLTSSRAPLSLVNDGLSRIRGWLDGER